MAEWLNRMREAAKEYNDLIYNAHTMLKDYYSYQELQWMPLRNLIDKVAEFKPRFQEIARRQQSEMLSQQLFGKQPGPKPGGSKNATKP